MTTIADTTGPFNRIGPLGPTMNDSGVVAFRAGLKAGGDGIFIGRGSGPLITIADTSGPFSGFQGLPVVNNSGTVVFRADLKEGGRGIYQGHGESLTTIADTRDLFSDIGLFPSANDKGSVVFSATLQAGGAGIFTVTEGQITTVVNTNSRFESFRGALINNRGTIIFFATPRGGELGIYSGPNPIGDKIISMGDPLFGSTVADFALNPVSLNDVGQIAIRVRWLTIGRSSSAPIRLYN